MTASSNPLLSSHQPSDVQVCLHPLVLLTISDYITRHSLRNGVGPIMGALLGQHSGRKITIEHAFECNTTPAPDEQWGYSLDKQRFLSRLEQCTSRNLAAPLVVLSFRPSFGPGRHAAELAIGSE